MRRRIILLLLIISLLISSISLAGCESGGKSAENNTGDNNTENNTENNTGGNTDNTPGDSVDDGDNGGNAPDDSTPGEPISGLVLVKENVAQFNIVISSSAGSGARKSATNLVKMLREDMGITVNDVVEDRDADSVSDCEIIIGPNVRNREDCKVSTTEFGDEGYMIKVIGNRVVIAGGTSQLTGAALDKFVKEIMGITDTTVSRSDITINSDLSIIKLTEYDVESFTIAGGRYIGVYDFL